MYKRPIHEMSKKFAQFPVLAENCYINFVTIKVSQFMSRALIFFLHETILT